jgi:hypothetical protein
MLAADKHLDVHAICELLPAKRRQRRLKMSEVPHDLLEREFAETSSLWRRRHHVCCSSSGDKS